MGYNINTFHERGPGDLSLHDHRPLCRIGSDRIGSGGTGYSRNKDREKKKMISN